MSLPTAILPPPLSTVISTNEKGEILYAIAIAHMRDGQLVKREIVYLHATDNAHARGQYCCMHPNRITHHIVGVAPVVGVFAHDEHGEKLSAD